MVVLSNVSKWYQNQVRVLNQISLELKKGEFLYVVGGTGAGKSSLLRMLATAEQPSAGTVSLFGYPLASASASTLRAIRQSLGYVPQDIKLISDVSVYDNVALSLSLAGRRVLTGQWRSRIHEMLERMGLQDKRSKLASTLSGGEAQRVAIARALIRAPELIIADEPTGAQDRDFKWLVMDFFLKANAGGATVVLATHDKEVVRRVRKRSAVLRAGSIEFEEALCIY